MSEGKYDVVVVGSGPNGLAAAIRMQQQGREVLLLEAKPTIGGGMRTAELTLPGFHHDICSAIHPLGAASPYFSQLPLEAHGLKWIFPEVAVAHPFDKEEPALLFKDIAMTAATLGEDAEAYKNLFEPFVKGWPVIANTFLGPLKIPSDVLLATKFGLKAIRPAKSLARSEFKGMKARGMFAGLAAHSMLPLENITTSAIGLMLGLLGHYINWPMPKGGSQSLADALAKYFESLGGTIKTDFEVTSLGDIPAARSIFFDLTPKQLLSILDGKLPFLYRKQLESFNYGQGVFKMDFALSAPIPWKDAQCGMAGTVHLGGTLEEIANAEKAVWENKHHPKPYVLLAQQSLFDPTRAPEGKHTCWAYCHVPNGSTEDMSEVIIAQIERFAPGFRDTILKQHIMNTADFQSYNTNYVGGDINGGAQDITQLFTRPVISLSPYSLPIKGMYICSSSTPPGGGVHGMCGYHAAERAIKDGF